MRAYLFVYLSGPMTASPEWSVEQNCEQGLRAHLTLLKMGIPNFCPHLSGAFPSAWSDVPYETWLQFDFAVIDRCTHMLMLPRWSASKGAVRERAYAIEKGIPVFHSMGEFHQWLLTSGPEGGR